MESGSENMELNQEIEDDVVEVEVQEAPPDGNVSVETSGTQSRRRLIWCLGPFWDASTDTTKQKTAM